MKKTILAIFTIGVMATTASAYMIGGAYANLVSCQWTQYGYQHGYVGTYNVNGQYYDIFFGGNYCPY